MMIVPIVVALDAKCSDLVIVDGQFRFRDSGSFMAMAEVAGMAVPACGPWGTGKSTMGVLAAIVSVALVCVGTFLKTITPPTMAINRTAIRISRVLIVRVGNPIRLCEVFWKGGM